MSLASEWINSTDGAVDEKLGLVAVKIPFTVSPGDSKLATLQHALTFVPVDLAGFTLPMIKRDVKERPDCGYDVNFSFEGHFTPEAADGEEFSLDGSTSDERIESHPEIDVLVAKYFPDGTTLKKAVSADGKIVFPISFTIDGQEQPNPLHGIETYLAAAMVWTRTFVSPNFPESLARQLGCVGSPPTGRLGQRPPSSARGPEWIMVRLKADWRGNIWKISESWLNSGRGGFPPDVYRYR